MARCIPWLLVLACGSACIDMGDPDADDIPSPAPRTLSDDARSNRVVIVHDMAPTTDPDVCTLLPPSGPCSLACDPIALGEQYLPPNTCAVFLCVLTDGRQVSVHACRHDE